MLIEKHPISDLQPAPYNPRILLEPGDPGWEKLERSLSEFDLVQPIVWNRKTGHIISGHKRQRVLQHRGDGEVDVVVVELSLEREKALNVALNNQEVGSDWDSSKLVSLLDDLQQLPEFDATLTGFDEQQLRDLVLAPEPMRLEDESPEESNLVDVTLQIPKDQFPACQERLNELIREFPDMQVHIQLATL